MTAITCDPLQRPLTSVTTIARLGLGLFPNGAMPANQLDVARTLFFQHAQKVIRISQKDLGYNILGTDYWLEDNAAGNAMTALDNLLLKGGNGLFF